MIIGDAPRLGIVIVMYNRDLHSLPVLSVAQQETGQLHLLIVDNSDQPASDAAANAASLGIDYQWMGGNRGISAAFNRGVERLIESVDYVSFLDQDTDGIESYVEQVKGALGTRPPDVLMPLVMSGHTILSPCQKIGPWYRSISKAGRLPDNFSCINSGMVVSASLLRRVRFDESLFLDYVDHQFVLDALTAGAEFEALWDCVLDQDYSRSTDTKYQAINRLAIFKKDIRVFYSRNHLDSIWANLLITWRVIRATAAYKTLDFVFPKKQLRAKRG